MKVLNNFLSLIIVLALVCALGCSFASAENGGEPIPFTEETDNTESTPSVEGGNESPETGEGEGGEGENESTPEQGGDSSEDSTQSQPDQTPEEDPSEPSEDDDDETSYVPITPDKPVDSNPADESWTTGDISTNYNPNQKGEPKAIRDLSAELSRWMIVTTIIAVFCIVGLVLVNKKYSNKKANSRSKKSAGPRRPRY